MAKAKGLTIKQKRFAEQFALDGNGTRAARVAGYRGNGNTLGVTAHENLRKPNVLSAINGELARVALEISPDRVRRRLDHISHEAEAAGQYGPAVRAEELLGKSIGMWIDLQLTGALSDDHVAALIGAARKRQAEPVDNRDTSDDD